MRQPILSTALAFLAACAALAQAPPPAPPVVNQPPDFSQIVGGPFTISAEASPSEVAVEEPIELRVTITGPASGKYVPRRASLKIFPNDIHEHFYLEAGADHASDGLWRFDYRLRPKSTAVSQIPQLKLMYYAVRQQRYQPAYSDAIAIQVKQRPAAQVEINGLNIVPAPASFFELAELPTRRGAMSAGVPMIAWLGVLLVPPLLCLAGVWAWRRTHPAAYESRQRRRHHAAQQALAAISKNDAAAADLQTVLTDYLRNRLDFATLEPTPRDVDAWLKRRGVRPPLRQRWRRFFQDCAAARFTPGDNRGAGPAAAQAAELIHDLEADACVAGGR